ncbi:MAG: hypothetical protein ACRD0H_22225, partial [Actinomycetes bacterium]
MRRTALLLAALIAAGLLNSACGYDPGDVQAGDCFKTGTAAAFGWGTEVPCDEPHTVEVFAVKDVSDTLGQYRRDELQETDNPARRQYLALMREFCEPEWSNYTGFGDLGAALAPDAVVLPAIYGDMALEATPPSEWDGEHKNKTVICYQVFGRSGIDDGQPTVLEHRVLDTLVRPGAQVPLQVRDCTTSPTSDQGELRVSCDQPHDREYLGHLNLTQFLNGAVPGLDQEFLDQLHSATSPQADWAVLDG